MNVQEFAELAAGHALHALSPDDERAFAAALAEHPEWAGIVDTDAATAVVLSEGVSEVAPPPSIRAGLLAQIAQGSHDSETPSALEAEPAVETDPFAALPLLPAVTAEEAAQADPVEPPASTDMLQTVQRRTWTRGVFALAASIALLVALGFGAALVGELLTPKPAAVVANRRSPIAPPRRAHSGAYK